MYTLHRNRDGEAMNSDFARLLLHDPHVADVAELRARMAQDPLVPSIPERLKPPLTEGVDALFQQLIHATGEYEPLGSVLQGEMIEAISQGHARLDRMLPSGNPGLLTLIAGNPFGQPLGMERLTDRVTRTELVERTERLAIPGVIAQPGAVASPYAWLSQEAQEYAARYLAYHATDLLSESSLFDFRHYAAEDTGRGRLDVEATRLMRRVNVWACAARSCLLGVVAVYARWVSALMATDFYKGGVRAIANESATADVMALVAGLASQPFPATLRYSANAVTQGSGPTDDSSNTARLHVPSRWDTVTSRLWATPNPRGELRAYMEACEALWDEAVTLATWYATWLQIPEPLDESTVGRIQGILGLISSPASYAIPGDWLELPIIYHDGMRASASVSEIGHLAYSLVCWRNPAHFGNFSHIGRPLLHEDVTIRAFLDMKSAAGSILVERADVHYLELARKRFSLGQLRPLNDPLIPYQGESDAIVIENSAGEIAALFGWTDAELIRAANEHASRWGAPPPGGYVDDGEWHPIAPFLYISARTRNAQLAATPVPTYAGPHSFVPFKGMVWYPPVEIKGAVMRDSESPSVSSALPLSLQGGPRDTQ